ncbi:hypothetical protein BH11ACT3_BH11ACT3_16270 [soil metagenome]
MIEIVDSPLGLTVAGAGPDLLRELLAEVEAIVASLTPQYLQSERSGVKFWQGPRPGLSEAEIRERLALIGVEPPAEVVTWWSWHDGWEIPLSMSPITLQRSIQQRTEQEDLGTELDQWNPDWLWVAGASNDAIAVRCNPVEEPPLVRRLSPWVYGFQPDGVVEHQVVSLCTPTAMMLNAIESEQIRVVDGEWKYPNRREIPHKWNLTQLA